MSFVDIEENKVEIINNVINVLEPEIYDYIYKFKYINKLNKKLLDKKNAKKEDLKEMGDVQSGYLFRKCTT